MKIELKKMKLKYFLILVFVLVYSSNLNAQNNLDKITGLSSTSASVAYSLRQLSSNYFGPLVRIKVVNSFYDVYPDVSTTKFSLSSKISAAIGTYDAAVATASTNALSTIISGSTDATVAIWYDQSGNGVNVLSSNPNAKIITAGSINTIFGQPTIYFSGSNSSLGSSNTVDYSALSGATVNAVAQNVATTSGFAGIIGTAVASPTYPGYNISYSSPSSGYGSDGDGGFYGTSVTSTDIKVVTNIFIFNTKNRSKIYVNKELKTNVAVTSSGNNTITHSSSSKILIGVSRFQGSTTNFIGNISEAILFPSQLSDAVRNPLETNQTQTYLCPFVTITSSASGAVCAGTSVTFTATTYNFSGTPTYQWYKNSVAINGANSATYSTTSLTNNDVIRVSCSDASSIVSDASLSLWLDAGSASNVSGTTWTDLSGKGNNATFNSHQTYSSTGGGYFQFDGTANPVLINKVTSATTEVTMSAWVYITTGTTQGSFIKNGASFGYTFGAGGGGGFCPGTYPGMLLAGQGWLGSNSPTSNFTTGWQLVTMVITGSSPTTYKYYINGILANTATFNSPSAPNGSYTALGDNYGDGGGCTPFNGKMGAAYLYTKALSQSEITQNYNALAARFGLSTTSAATSNDLIAIITAGPSAVISVSGDGCINKTTLSTTSGLTSYVWYKDNVIISGITTNTIIPNASGDYKVVVSSGTCTNTSIATTIYTCGRTAIGKMLALTNAVSLISSEGGANFGTAIDDLGRIANTTGLTTTVGTIDGTTAVIGGVISSTNGIASSVGVIYSTDLNFGTYSTATIQTNVAAGTYTSTISGLSSSTSYYAKSFIINKAGTSYGTVISFTTPTVVPTKVAVTRASVGRTYGALFTTQPQVTIQTASGSTVTNSSATVTASINSGGALIGTKSVNAVNGVATFTNLGLKGMNGTAYTITYTVSGLTTATESVTPTGSWSLGSTGPGGGKVFYAATSGFACGQTLSETCYYLEVAPASANSLIDWSSPAYDAISVPGGTPGTAIGSGYPNTMAIIAQGNGTNSAAGYAQAYRGNGLSDWYLGTRLELYQIYLNRANVITGTSAEHGFAGQYWASEQDGPTNAWNYKITDNGGPWSDRKEGPNYVRPIRSF
jgi:hypothetical protein